MSACTTRRQGRGAPGPRPGPGFAPQEGARRSPVPPTPGATTPQPWTTCSPSVPANLSPGCAAGVAGGHGVVVPFEDPRPVALQGRGDVCFARGDETRLLGLRKTARSNSGGLNAEPRGGIRHGEDFSLDIPFYRTSVSAKDEGNRLRCSMFNQH
jgi:hypothetical protein